MKTITPGCFVALIMLMAVSCKKNPAEKPAPTGFTGKWTLVEIYGNDMWGGPAYWKPATNARQIEFTADGKYLTKISPATSYTLAGTWLKLSDSTIQITHATPPNPSYPAYTLNYTFSSGGYMTWGTFNTESRVKEKYRLDE